MNDWLFPHAKYTFVSKFNQAALLQKRGVIFDPQNRGINKSTKTSRGLKSHDVMKTESCYIFYNIVHLSKQKHVFIVFGSSRSNVVHTKGMSHCCVDPVEQGYKKSILHICILLISSASIQEMYYPTRSKYVLNQFKPAQRGENSGVWGGR